MCGLQEFVLFITSLPLLAKFMINVQANKIYIYVGYIIFLKDKTLLRLKQIWDSFVSKTIANNALLHSSTGSPLLLSNWSLWSNLRLIQVSANEWLTLINKSAMSVFHTNCALERSLVLYAKCFHELNNVCYDCQYTLKINWLLQPIYWYTLPIFLFIMWTTIIMVKATNDI